MAASKRDRTYTPTIVDAHSWRAAQRDPRGAALIARARAFGEALEREGRDHSRPARRGR